MFFHQILHGAGLRGRLWEIHAAIYDVVEADGIDFIT